MEKHNLEIKVEGHEFCHLNNRIGLPGDASLASSLMNIYSEKWQGKIG